MHDSYNPDQCQTVFILQLGQIIIYFVYTSSRLLPRTDMLLANAPGRYVAR